MLDVATPPTTNAAAAKLPAAIPPPAVPAAAAACIAAKVPPVTGPAAPMPKAAPTSAYGKGQTPQQLRQRAHPQWQRDDLAPHMQLALSSVQKKAFFGECQFGTAFVT